MKAKNNFKQIEEQLNEMRCKKCHGSGSVDDAEPGDISFREITCRTCYGTGWKDGHDKYELVKR